MSHQFYEILLFCGFTKVNINYDKTKINVTIRQFYNFCNIVHGLENIIFSMKNLNFMIDVTMSCALKKKNKKKWSIELVSCSGYLVMIYISCCYE